MTGGVATEFSVPFVLQMRVIPERQVARDRIDIDPHGGAFAHLDALCHMAYKGRFYNNVPYETATAAGCKLGINNLGGDSAQDVGVIPGCTNKGPVPTMCWNAVHKFAPVARGMHLFDNSTWRLWRRPLPG